METLRTELANFRADVEKRMHSMTRQFYVVLVTVLLGVAGVVVKFR